MSWTDSAPITDEDSLELLEERRKTCKALIALHATELQRWEALKAKVDTAIQMKSLKIQIEKTPKPTMPEADLLEHYKKLVETAGKQPPKETKEGKVEAKAESQTAKPAETKSTNPAPVTKSAEPAKTELPKAQEVEVRSPEPQAKPAEPVTPAEPSTKPAEPPKPEEPVKPTEPAKPEEVKSTEPSVAGQEAKDADSSEEPTNLGSLGSKPKIRGSTSRAPPTMKKEPLVFTPTVVAPSQAEMEEMEKKRIAEEATATPKPKKVQPVGFNPLLGMKSPAGPAVKYDKCNDCSCDDFSPDTFKKGKCSNCFHIHPVSKDAPPSPATSPVPTPAEEEEQPPPPTTPHPNAKTPEKADEPKPPAPEPKSPAPLVVEDLKPPATESGGVSPNNKRLIGAKGFNLGLAPTEAPTEPVVKCKECGCDEFSPDSFKKTKCSNCFHVHSGAPPPPKTGGPKPEEPVVDSTPKCKDCGCSAFKSDPFKKSKCANCFHNHV